MPLTAGLIIAGTASAIKTGIGFSQTASSRADQLKNIRPTFAIPQEWYDNDHIAGSQAEHGLTEPAMNYYTTQAGRGLSSGLGTTLQGGGSVNNVADLYDTYDTGINKISAEDAQLKNANIESYIKAHSNLGNEKEKAWTLNEYQPYLDRSKANAEKLAAGQQNIVGGITDLGNDVVAYSNSKNSVPKGAAVTTTADRSGDLPAAVSSGFSGINLDSSIANPDVFSTPGGKSALTQLISTNRNSPYLQALIQQQLNQSGQLN